MKRKYNILILILFLLIYIVYIDDCIIENFYSTDKPKLSQNKFIKKIQFLDFWPGYDIKNNWFTELLTKYNYKFNSVDENPDIIIFSVFGTGHQKFLSNKNIKKVFYTGENVRPKVGIDLNLTFDNTTDHNNIRLPLWILYGGSRNKNMKLSKKNVNKFCCFVYSNDVEFRNSFCKKLSSYKQVDCGGGSLNNIGGKVSDKNAFQIKYKFCIAYENSLHPGYTTEKILQSYESNCIPIYYGSVTITDDFNPETFINAHDFKNDDDLINYIKKVDNDDQLYNSFLNKPIFSKKWLDIFNDPNETYFKTICKEIMK
jgi:alpha(1,3/1,4) fucosyltransferase